MQGWIIYNGALRIKKNEVLVKKLAEEGLKKGIRLQLIKNNTLIPMYDAFGKATLESTALLETPDFIIFWDKDIALARHLEIMGFKLFNRSKAIATCDNKILMHQKLAQSGIRLPKTIVNPFVFRHQDVTMAYIQKVRHLLGDTIVLKEAHGSFGMQVSLVHSEKELLDRFAEMENRPFIMQEYIESSYGRDLRVNIIGDKVVGAMMRKNEDDFRANITLGGRGSITEITDTQKYMALKAHKILGLDFSGVDILYDKNDQPILCEVNSNVNYLSFEGISGFNFSAYLLDYIVSKLDCPIG